MAFQPLSDHPRQHWLVTADGRRAALFACSKTPGGEIHVDAERSIENSHEQEHERQRPSMLGGTPRVARTAAGSSNAAPKFASFSHNDEEDERRFAREIGEWLMGAGVQLEIKRVSVFAPPRMLSILREELAPLGKTNARMRTDFHEGELAHLRTSDLATHPAILRAIGEEFVGQQG